MLLKLMCESSPAAWRLACRRALTTNSLVALSGLSEEYSEVIMPELKFDQPVPELTEQEDAETLAAIAEGNEQLDGGRGIPLEELRKEFVRRCSK